MPRRLYSLQLAQITAALIVTTSLFAGNSRTVTAENSTVTTATPFFACPAPCVESFDSVAPPALPAGWTATLATGQPGDLAWVTVNSPSDSFPNSVTANSATHITDNRLDSPALAVGSTGAVLTFERRNDLEPQFDGMVLEISNPFVAGGAFQDIITAGGSFTEGGYNSTITQFANSPIAGRAAWSGDTGAFGFDTTSVRLPASANGRSVTFRWRLVTDTSIAAGGAFIDSIKLFQIPANDNFSNAQPILGASGIIEGTNEGASKEPNEPNHAGINGNASVWYRWQAPDNGTFVFTTFGSTSDTLLAVYTGNSLPGTHIASNDAEVFGCFGIPPYSGVSFNAVGGTIYHIAVDKKESSISGIVRLRWGRDATITGRITNASQQTTSADTIRLEINNACYRIGENGLVFRHIPTGVNYNVTVQSSFSSLFSPYPNNPSISPLTGNVSTLNFYRITPAHSISGTVTMPGDDETGLAMTCVSTPGALVSRQAVFLGKGKYQCAALPTGAEYLLTPTKVGFTFTPPERTVTVPFADVFFINFTGAEAPLRTISGRITTSTGTGLGGISIALSGSQTASKTTNGNGDYSFTDVLQGGNYTVTPTNQNVTFAPTSLSFNNLTANQTADFTGSFLLQLILDETGQATALDSVLLLRDPFAVVNNANLLNPGVDKNTRVTIFVSNLTLAPGELSSSVVINLVGSNNQSFDILAEDVRASTDPTFTQITFRLPDNLSSGICTLAVKAHGLTSNIGPIKIK